MIKVMTSSKIRSKIEISSWPSAFKVTEDLTKNRTLIIEYSAPRKAIKSKMKVNAGRFAIWMVRKSVRAICFEILLSSKAMLTVLPPTFKSVLQQIRLLQVAWIQTSDWITLRGSHAIHRSNARLPWTGKTCNIMYRFCRTTHFFLQQSFDTIIIKANKLVGSCVKRKEIYQL